MPDWLYTTNPLLTALTLLAIVEVLSMIGLMLVRRLVLPRLNYRDAPNEAVSGTVQAIGVFYGITVGLIAVAVWNTNSEAKDLASREAAAISKLYRDTRGYPYPLRDELGAQLHDYAKFIIEQAWPAQQAGFGQKLDVGHQILNNFQYKLYRFEPKTSGEEALHEETLSAYNELLEYRRLRLEAVENRLPTAMWIVIWAGAVISISVAYFYRIEDPKLHAILISLMAAFLAMLLFMIVVNDRPFYGRFSIPADPYKLILDNVINRIG
jgi:phosphotransferase system  glucose/maltose/N-acetylglucosamine-specific IIC component